MLLLAPWLFAACAPLGPGPDDTGPLDTGPGGDSDVVDSDTNDSDANDSDEEPTDTGAASGPCPPFMGIGPVGSWRRWRSTQGTPGTWTLTTASIAGDQVTLRYEAEWNNPSSGASSTDGTYVYRCDEDGAWLLSLDTRNEFLIQGSPAWNRYIATYSPPELALPADAGPGDSWTSTTNTSWTSTSSYAAPSSGTDAWTTQTSIGTTSQAVTVPAGTFEAYRFTAVQNYHGTTTTLSWWTNEDLGLVRSDSTELLAHSP